MSVLIYMAPVLIDYDNPNGVGKKVLAHCSVFSLHYHVVLISYTNNGIKVSDFVSGEKKSINCTAGKRRKEINRSVLSAMFEYRADYIYIRYHLSDWGFIKTLSILRKSWNPKIAIEIPTYPYSGEFIIEKSNLKRAVKDIIRKNVDAINRSKLKKYINRIITYSNDSEIFGIKTIKTINGVIFENIKPIDRKERDNTIDLISVSVTSAVHGFDRIICGLHDYYANGGKRDVHFHIVGNGSEIEKYKKLVDDYNLVSKVTIYGFLNGDRLDQVYEKADIAINSLGLHRKGLKTESTLKNKEYAAKGLPVVSCYEIDAFSQEDNREYVLCVPMDETPVRIEDVIAFYDHFAKKPLKVVVEEIRNAAEGICDMKVTLKPIIHFFGE